VSLAAKSLGTLSTSKSCLQVSQEKIGKIQFFLPLVERKRISKEILMLKNLKHPNIIHFIGTWINKAKEEVVFITEIVTGGSLKSYMTMIFA
jgi:serine/threonine protein kinase